jgi:hypothetical protein
MNLSAEQVAQYHRDGAVAFHAKAAKAMRDVLYAGAETNPQRL